MTETTTAQEITITRVIEAPRELVWQVWTEPEHIAAWWGGPGADVVPGKLHADVRTGGRFSITTIGAEDGFEMTILGVYTEVVPPERLVMEEPAEDSWHDGAVSTLTLSDLGDGRTELTVRTTVNTTDEMRVQARGGMERTFDRLAEYVESLAK